MIIILIMTIILPKNLFDSTLCLIQNRHSVILIQNGTDCLYQLTFLKLKTIKIAFSFHETNALVVSNRFGLHGKYSAHHCKYPCRSDAYIVSIPLTPLKYITL